MCTHGGGSLSNNRIISRCTRDFGKVDLVTVSWALCLLILISACSVFADLDVNAVAGIASIGGLPAPAGKTIVVRTNSYTTTTKVDGPNIPPFQRGVGRFDTGDVPQFNTGDTVTVSFQDPGINGQTSKTLQAGTTSVNLEGDVQKPPSINGVPDQYGTEDVPWDLDLDPFISDPDTPKSSLDILVSSSYVTVTDHIINFLYPEGITSDTVSIRVSDHCSSDVEVVDVVIEPVNDPPEIFHIPDISLIEGSGTSVNLSSYVNDPDDPVSSINWTVVEQANLEAWFQGHIIQIEVPMGIIGENEIQVRAQDPDGLADLATIRVEVGTNITALMEFYGSQIDDLNDQITDLLEENSILTSQLTELNLDISSLEKNNSDLLDLLEEAQSSANSLQDELDSLRAQGRLQAETIEELKLEKEQLEEIISALEDDSEETVSSLLTTIYEINATCQGYISQIAGLNSIIQDLESNITRLETESKLDGDLIETLINEKEDLNDLLESKERELDDLENLAGSLQGKAEDLEQQKADAEDALAEIETSLQVVQAENTELQSRLDKLRNMAPAMIIQGTNSSEGNGTLASKLIGKAANLAMDGARLVVDGMDSSLVLLVVAIIAISSVVTIAARTSWLQIGSIGQHNTADEFWRTIESRTMRDSGSNSLKYLGDKNGVNSTESKTMTSKPGAETKSSKIMVMRKPTPPKNREKRQKVVASTRPVSVKRRVPKMARALEKLADEVEITARKKVGPSEKAKAGEKPEPAEVKVKEPVKVEENAGKKQEDESNRAKPQKVQDPSKNLDSSGLSEVDREYIKMLIEMGFTKEAEEELRKRSS